MTLCEQLKVEFTKEIEVLIKSWKEKMAKDKEYNLMDEYYKEQIKLETADQLKNLFIQYYDRFCREV